MKIALIVVGKTSQPYLTEGIDEYVSRIKRYMPFELYVIPELKNTRNLTMEQQKNREGDALLKALQPGDCVVLLDEHGKELTSLQFAAYIEQKQQTSARRLVFVIGGPYGFSPDVYERCQEKLSLSKMTFSHQMVRLFFTEQLYRAMTILNNEPYHHE